ncbi:MAG: ATP-binding protein, partial [Ktedonobacterales bacterium]|nr:ATP-binding protein [Ktedonobacterales bacterium]
LRATLPGARLDAVPAPASTPPRASTIAVEYTLTSQTRPLAADPAEAVSTTLLASLQPLRRGERVCIQVILTSAGTPQPLEGTVGAAAARHEKQGSPLLVATLRIGVAAASRQRASSLLARTESMLHGVNVPGVQLVRRHLPASRAARRLARRSYPFIEWPLLLNAQEATSLLLFPFRAYLPGVPTGQARQLPPPPQLPTRGVIIGTSNYPGLTHRRLALTASDRLHHLHLIGPTGTGKSTLLAQLALQDIAAGHGVIVVDLGAH